MDSTIVEIRVKDTNEKENLNILDYSKMVGN